MLPKTFKTLTLFALLIAAFVSFNALPVGAQTEEAKQLHNTVEPLLKQGKHIDALPLLERLIQLEPENANNQLHLGFALWAKARTVNDKEEIQQFFERARKAFIKAKQLGSTEPKLDAFIEMPTDRDLPSFTKNAETEKLMQEAESFFAQGKMDEALKKYQQALQLDPRLYYAALFSGDVYVHKEDYPNAETWYQKAIQIDPLIETAYRYSATPLMKQKKYDQARERYVEAYITDPFNKLAVGGLVQWAQVTGAKLGHPKIDIPASVGSGKNGEVNITLGMGEDNGDGSFAWTVYGLKRATWQTSKEGLGEDFKKAYPNEKVYRHSLAEEFAALKTTVTVLKESMNSEKKSIKKLNPQLANLVKLHDEGLLEPYILLVMADRGIYQDYAPYLKQNRDKLRRYVVEYVVTGGGK
jgi:tetratricopeptide (TPR) repeat protein